MCLQFPSPHLSPPSSPFLLQAEIEQYVALGTEAGFAAAKDVYENGQNSGGSVISGVLRGILCLLVA